MKRHHYVAAGLVLVALMLALEGVFAYLGWSAIRALDVLGPTNAKEVTRIRDLAPLVYALAIESVLFGLASSTLVFAVILQKRWAERVLVFFSLGLAVTAAALIALSPGLWERQGFFLLCCLCFWWMLHRERTRRAL